MLRRAIVIASCLLAPAFALGCGPGTPAANVADVQPATMPADATWDGVYYSPLFGYLHVKQDGSTVQARWLRPQKGSWGKLAGTVEGNLLRFEWEEYVDGLVGPNSKKVGRGYFLYTRPDGSNVDDVIKGEVGRGQDEVGIEWTAIKQRNVEADLESIGGTGASDIGGGDWDSAPSESGDIEPPSEPPQNEAPAEP